MLNKNARYILSAILLSCFSLAADEPDYPAADEHIVFYPTAVFKLSNGAFAANLHG